MENALLRLRELSQSFSQAEQTVANRILAEPELVERLSIHALAAKTYSSPSTIVRMCCHTGFSGFKDFKKAVIWDLGQRNQSLTQHQKALEAGDSLEQIADFVTQRNILSLEDSRKLLDMETLQRCIDRLEKARMLYLFGMGASLCAAQDAYLKFLRMNRQCTVNADWHSQLLQARNAGREDAALVFSYSGHTVEMVECVKALRENGTPILAITRCIPSPISELADERLYISANESLFRSGAMASRLSQLNMVDILCTALTMRRQEQSLEQLSRTRISKPGEE